MKIKVQPKGKMFLIQEAGTGKSGKEPFTLATLNGMSVVLYRSRYAMLDVSPQDFIKKCIAAIDKAEG